MWDALQGMIFLSSNGWLRGPAAADMHSCLEPRNSKPIYKYGPAFVLWFRNSKRHYSLEDSSDANSSKSCSIIFKNDSCSLAVFSFVCCQLLLTRSVCSRTNPCTYLPAILRIITDLTYCPMESWFQARHFDHQCFMQHAVTCDTWPMWIISPCPWKCLETLRHK